MNEEIQKQCEQDVSVYGDNAYLMWEISVNNTSEFHGMFCNSYLNELFIHNKPGSFVYELLWKGTEVKRKESAALPFDIKRAKAGDEVEICTLRGWVNCGSKTFKKRKYPLIQLDNISVSVHNLRMKFPPKAKP